MKMKENYGKKGKIKMFWIGLGIAIAGIFIGEGLESGLKNFGKGENNE